MGGVYADMLPCEQAALYSNTPTQAYEAAVQALLVPVQVQFLKSSFVKTRKYFFPNVCNRIKSLNNKYTIF